MQYTQLGRTGLTVSRLCLGTMNFGPRTSEADAFAIMDQALAMGINFFDTANMYGAWTGRGTTEQIVGRWLAQGGGRRERIVLATKVYNPMPVEGQPEVNRDQRGLSAMKIIRHCEDSLRRLQVDTIDLYQMHHIDRNAPVAEIFHAMETLQRQGKIIYVGSSNFAGWDIATYNQFAEQTNRLGLISEQSVYNLDNRMVELEVLPACRHYGLGVIPWSPLAGGKLAGFLDAKPDPDGRRGNENARQRFEADADKLRRWEDLCKQLGHAPSNVALAWLLSNDVVTAPIIGPRTMEQLTESAKALDIQLDQTTLDQLDEIFPGPGGAAPNAYAW